MIYYSVIQEIENYTKFLKAEVIMDNFEIPSVPVWMDDNDINVKNVNDDTKKTTPSTLPIDSPDKDSENISVDTVTIRDIIIRMNNLENDNRKLNDRISVLMQHSKKIVDNSNKIIELTTKVRSMEIYLRNIEGTIPRNFNDDTPPPKKIVIADKLNGKDIILNNSYAIPKPKIGNMDDTGHNEQIKKVSTIQPIREIISYTRNDEIETKRHNIPVDDSPKDFYFNRYLIFSNLCLAIIDDIIRTLSAKSGSKIMFSTTSVELIGTLSILISKICLKNGGDLNIKLPDLKSSICTRLKVLLRKSSKDTLPRFDISTVVGLVRDNANTDISNLVKQILARLKCVSHVLRYPFNHIFAMLGPDIIRNSYQMIPTEDGMREDEIVEYDIDFDYFLSNHTPTSSNPRALKKADEIKNEVDRVLMKIYGTL